MDIYEVTCSSVLLVRALSSQKLNPELTVQLNSVHMVRLRLRVRVSVPARVGVRKIHYSKDVLV